MAARFEIKESSNGQYYFRLVAANNEVILSSEMYTEKASAKKGIASVKENAPKDERYDRRTSGYEQPYFVLLAGNNKVIGKSEVYSSKQAMENGIEAVKKAAPSAEIVE